ncbi:hypothetical protein BGZ54_003080 [Gamsiella multidivaricata]|nr:hypothetical protein BGZ54_003080 [Gamsiella multidivaricata]
MKLVPWEDILEVFPNAIYLRDANGIVMPARNNTFKRITPRSIKLQSDVVLEVVSAQDIPPASTRPANITKTEDLAKESSLLPAVTGSSSADRWSSEQEARNARISTSTTESNRGITGSSQQHQQHDEAESDWSPFQANSASTSTSSAQTELLRQEMIHRMELLSAEQEERLDIVLKAYRRPTRS